MQRETLISQDLWSKKLDEWPCLRNTFDIKDEFNEKFKEYIGRDHRTHKVTKDEVEDNRKDKVFCKMKDLSECGIGCESRSDFSMEAWRIH